jgi:hypothetical protein
MITIQMGNGNGCSAWDAFCYGLLVIGSVYEPATSTIRSTVYKTFPQSDVRCCSSLSKYLRFQLPTSATMKMTGFWNVAPCILIEVD